jgi:alpha-mannosidase
MLFWFFNIVLHASPEASEFVLPDQPLMAAVRLYPAYFGDIMRRCFSPVASFLSCLILLHSASAQKPEKPDLSKQPTLYVVGYAHLDTEWRWEYPQVINEYLRNTLHDNFKLIDKYPHYIFNFSGANRYRLMKEYYPSDFERMKQYVKEGRWFPAGSSMEEGDVNTPSAETIIRQILYGNHWFRKELGRASAEYMLPDCFGFPASLPTILAHSGVKGFSTQKLVWGSSAPGGGLESREQTPEGTPFNVGVWVGPDGESVLAGANPGDYNGDITSDLSKPLPPEKPDTALSDLQAKVDALRAKRDEQERNKQTPDPNQAQELENLRQDLRERTQIDRDRDLQRFQHDWAARVELNGKVSGVFTDYHYYWRYWRIPARRIGEAARGYRYKGDSELSNGRRHRHPRRAYFHGTSGPSGRWSRECNFEYGGTDVSEHLSHRGQWIAALYR